jgi:hypothetical protein
MTRKPTIGSTILRCLGFLAVVWICYYVADMAASLRAMREDAQAVRMQIDLFALRR